MCVGCRTPKKGQGGNGAVEGLVIVKVGGDAELRRRAESLRLVHQPCGRCGVNGAAWVAAASHDLSMDYLVLTMARGNQHQVKNIIRSEYV